MKLIEGSEVVTKTPLGVYSGLRWDKQVRGNGWMTGYFTTIRGWRLSIFAIHDGTYCCQVEERNIDDYSFLFASASDAKRLLAYLLKPVEYNDDELFKQIRLACNSSRDDFWRYQSLTKFAYRFVKGRATGDRKRMLDVVLKVREQIEYGYGIRVSESLDGYENVVDWILT